MIGRLGRRRLLVGALLAAMAAVVVFVVFWTNARPTPAEQTARDFLAAWGRTDYATAYSFLSTSIAEDVFVDALPHSALSVRGLAIDRVIRQDDRQAVIAYRADVPDASSAVGAVVFANRLRYPDACAAANAKRATYRRIGDVLGLEKAPAGQWRVGFRGDTDFSQQGARLLALSFDLAPQFIWNHITAGLDSRDEKYDDQVIFEALTVYRNDLGLDGGGGDFAAQSQSIRGYVRDVAKSCGSSPTA